MSQGPEKPPGQGITPRAVLIGVILIPCLCAWNVYSDIVAQSAELAVMSLSIGIVAALLLLLAVNGFVKRVAPCHALSGHELRCIYVMQTVSLGLSGVGMTQFLILGLSNVFYYADGSNRWAQRYQPLLPRWAFPDPAALPDFYRGHSALLAAAHLRGWLLPIGAWTLFLLALAGVMLCLSLLLRRRWVDEERLTFPIVILPMELTRPEGARTLWRSPVLWVGFGLAFGLEMLAGAAFLWPTLPFLPLKPSDPRLNLGSLFQTFPWNALGEFNLGFYPLVIGLAFFLPLDVSFSCGFFFLLRKAEDVLTALWGWHDPGAPPALARFPYTGEQGLGAFLGLALWSLLPLLRRRTSAAGLAARFGGRAADARLERWAWGGLLAGGLFLLAFAILLGVPAPAAAALLALFLLVVVAYARIRAEAGLPWAFGPDMTPHQAILAAVGPGAIPLHGLVGLTQLQWLDLDYRCTLMPAHLEALKIGTDSGFSFKRLAGVILLATLTGALSSWAAILTCYYHYGAASAQVSDWRVSMGSAPWRILDGWGSGPQPTDWPRLGGVLVGAGVTALLSAARGRFLWWPLSPIGYVLSGTFTMVWLWCPLLVGWAAKALLLSGGGLKTYRAALPFFIGLILGDYVAAGLWAVAGCLLGVPTYRVAP